MNWQNVQLIFRREVLDQLRDRRTLFMIVVLPLLLYPALGIGMVQLTVLFAEQPRTVVVLGTADLPALPLIDGDRFVADWFRVPEESDKLEVISDSVPTTAIETTALERRQRLLEQAQGLREDLIRRSVVEAQLVEAEHAGDLEALATLKQQLAELIERLGQRFGDGELQVLIVIPESFAANLETLKRDVVSRQENVAGFDYPRPVVLHNSADEKSLIAASRVERVLDAWEREILRQALKEVGLPASLPAPVNAHQVDLAEEQQLSANVWSKLFPAMLVIMALTGAFYPAIDLGAGEKERGTMETLLICPATRTEIVLGKFFTVMLFSAGTALLNLSSIGFTGKYMLSLTAGGGPAAKLGDLALPPLSSLAWLVVVLIPLSALFSALCLALATFARSSKEGQYYLTPLLMVTLGLTVFCLSPAVEMQPFYSVMPVMGPALLLKGLLLNNHESTGLLLYAAPVLLTSFAYCAVALWWAIDQFGSEDVLFREAEQFDLRLWIQHLLRDKEPMPTFSEAAFCFVLIMLLQFFALKTMQTPLQLATAEERPVLMVQLLIIQQMVMIATPALLMGVMLTTSPRLTFRLQRPPALDLLVGLLLPVALHPLTLEMAAALAPFFPPLPPGVAETLASISSDQLVWWLPLLAFAVAPAICEELAFRGFILSGFLESGRGRLAIVLSALTFGVMHLIPQQVLNAALLGLVLGLIALRSGSLWPCIAFHLVYNGLEVSRGRWGKSWTSDSPFWKMLFRNEEGLRYQPLLLLLCAFAAVLLMAILLRPRAVRLAPPDTPGLPPDWSTAANPGSAPAGTPLASTAPSAR